MDAAPGIGGNGHLRPGDDHRDQGEQDRAERVAARQRGEQQGQQEGVKQQSVPSVPAKCRYLGRCRLDGAAAEGEADWFASLPD